MYPSSGDVVAAGAAAAGQIEIVLAVASRVIVDREVDGRAGNNGRSVPGLKAIGPGRLSRSFGGGRTIRPSRFVASVVALAFMSLSPPSGSSPRMRRQNSLDKPYRVGRGSAARCARSSAMVLFDGTDVPTAFHSGVPPSIETAVRADRYGYGSKSAVPCGISPQIAVGTTLSVLPRLRFR